MLLQNVFVNAQCSRLWFLKQLSGNWKRSLQKRSCVFFFLLFLFLADSALLRALCFAFSYFQSFSKPCFSVGSAVFICFLRFFFLTLILSISSWRLDFFGGIVCLGYFIPWVSLHVAYMMSPYVASLCSRVLFPTRASSLWTIFPSSFSHSSVAFALGRLSFWRLASRACVNSSSESTAWMSLALWFKSWPWSSNVLSAAAERCCLLR